MIDKYFAISFAEETFYFFSFAGLTAKQLSAAQAAAQGMSVDQMKNFVQNDLRNLVRTLKIVYTNRLTNILTVNSQS